MIGNIGKLKELLDIRHWVAHGRSWTLVRDIKSYPPLLVARAIAKLNESLAKAANLGNVSPFSE